MALERIHHPQRGFTLVELLVAMSIFVIVTVMTIGAINLGLTGESVRTTARSVQSKLEGARDRAIYHSKRTVGEPRNVGVRLLVDENNPTICRRLVYIQSDGRDGSDSGMSVELERLAPNSVRLVNTGSNWPALYDRGLIGPGTVVNVYDSTKTNFYTLTIDPAAFQMAVTNTVDLVWVDTTPQLHPNAPLPSAPANTLSPSLSYFIDLNPDVLAVEDALELPNGVCIDLETSQLPDSWNLGIDPTTLKPIFSNRMDIMFTAQGPCVGDAAAAGIIHLHICDVADALEDTLPGSPTTPNDFDGDGQPDERHGNELGLTIFGKSGRVISHPMSVASYPVPPAEQANLAFVDAADFDSDPSTLGYWQPSTAYSVGDIVAPRVYNGMIFEALVAGTSGAGPNEPTSGWSVVPGGLTDEGGLVWLARKHAVWEFGLEGEVAR